MRTNSIVCVCAAAMLSMVVVIGSPSEASDAAGPIVPPTMNDQKPRDYAGIHNAVAFREGFISGSVPEGEEGFKTLAAMGVKTIISVDGAEPDVQLAKKYGMRYIHLPIGYNGFDEDRKLELTRATRDAVEKGPVYIHCHHGKHRSAGAAGTIAVSMGWANSDQMVERMKVSGAAANYKGLYACTSDAKPLDKSAIDAVSPNFPEISTPTGYVKGMVEMEEVFDHLKAIEKAGWVTPKDHPDLVPAAEAGRLADLFRYLHETDYAKAKPQEFNTLMTQSHEEAQTLEDLIVANEKDAAKLSAQFKLISNSCKTCHASYRD